MAQQPSYIVIDSRDRIHSYETSSNFTVQFNPSLRGMKTLKVKSITIPLCNYNIDSTNNLIYFSDGTNYIATIPEGIYDNSTILGAIKVSMEATAYAGIITASYDLTSHKYSIAGTVNFELQFGSFTANSMSYILGFNDIDTGLAASHEANNISNLSVPDYFFINMSGLNNQIRSTNGQHASFIVFTYVHSGHINHHLEKTHYHMKNSNNSHVMQRAKIELKDKDGNIFDINNCDWSMLLEITYY